MRGSQNSSTSPLVEDDVIVLAGGISRLVLALLSEAVLADEASFQEQFDGVVQGRPAHLGAALLHAVQQGVDVEMTPSRVHLLQHSEAFWRLPVPALREEGFETLSHLFQQILHAGSASFFRTTPRSPARNPVQGKDYVRPGPADGPEDLQHAPSKHRVSSSAVDQPWLSAYSPLGLHSPPEGPLLLDRPNHVAMEANAGFTMTMSAPSISSSSSSLQAIRCWRGPSPQLRLQNACALGLGGTIERNENGP